MVTPSAIELHIEELVLHGFSPHNSADLGAAVEREIVRLLQVQGLPSGLIDEANVSVDHLNAGSFNVMPHNKAAAVGAQIAQSVYTSFTK